MRRLKLYWSPDCMSKLSRVSLGLSATPRKHRTCRHSPLCAPRIRTRHLVRRGIAYAQPRPAPDVYAGSMLEREELLPVALPAKAIGKPRCCGAGPKRRAVMRSRPAKISEAALLADRGKGGALFREGAGGLGDRFLRLCGRRLRRRRGGGPAAPVCAGRTPAPSGRRCLRVADDEASAP